MRYKSFANAVARSLAVPEKEAGLSVNILQLNVLSDSCSALSRDGEDVGEEISNCSETGMGVGDG